MKPDINDLILNIHAISQYLNCDLGDSITLSQLSLRQGVTTDFIYPLLPDRIRNAI